jgi:hypothetical protein
MAGLPRYEHQDWTDSRLGIEQKAVHFSGHQRVSFLGANPSPSELQL